MINRFKLLWRATRKYLFVVLVAILFYEALEHVELVRSAVAKLCVVMTPIFIGLIIAFVVNIPATAFRNLLKKLGADANSRRTYYLSILFGYLLVLGVIAVLFAVVVPKITESVNLLAANATDYYVSVSEWIGRFGESFELSDKSIEQINIILNSLVERLQSGAITLISQALTFTLSAVRVIVSALLGLVFSIYALLVKDKLLAQARRFIRALLCPRSSETFLKTCSIANATYRSYFAGQLVSCSIIGIMCYICMRLFSMPFPEMISMLIAVFALIPILGPWLSTVPSAFIILMASPDNPLLCVWFIVMILVIQQIDNNLVYPRVVGNAVGLSAVWVLAAIIIGGGLFGFTGLLFAVPTTAVLYRLIGDWTHKRARERGIPIVETVPHQPYNLRGKRIKRYSSSPPSAAKGRKAASSKKK